MLFDWSRRIKCALFSKRLWNSTKWSMEIARMVCLSSLGYWKRKL